MAIMIITRSTFFGQCFKNYINPKCFVTSRRNRSTKKDKSCDTNPKPSVKSPCKYNVKEKFECYTPPCMVDQCQNLPKIVIVGAGMAGLSAAQRLAYCGIKEFTILEANDRPGGRIHSCWMGDIVAELGAQWILGGCVANPALTLACQEGLLKSPLFRYKPFSGLFMTSDGRAIDKSVSQTAYHTFEQILHQAYSLFSLSSERDHGSLMDFFSIRIQQELQHFPQEQRYDSARVMFGLTNGLRSRWGADLTQLSADQFGSYIEIPGGNVRVPLGFTGILAPLIRDIPECNIKYCKPVQTIRWGSAGDSTPRALVKCCDGDEFPADHVIVTVSLGVLKSQADKMFSPCLTEEKLEAIRKLGYGCINKIFLQYSRPFWVWEEGNINLAWSMDELKDRADWFKGICSLKEMPGSHHVLQAYVSGREATMMEKCTDEEVAEEITSLLRQFTGDPSLPFPSSILRSRWSSDPYFVGASSFMGLDSTVGHQCDLGAPLPGSCEPTTPILLFAGEATCPGHFSTVHGARLSGIREADRIVQLVKSGQVPQPCKTCP